MKTSKISIMIRSTRSTLQRAWNVFGPQDIWVGNDRSSVIWRRYVSTALGGLIVAVLLVIFASADGFTLILLPVMLSLIVLAAHRKSRPASDNSATLQPIISDLSAESSENSRLNKTDLPDHEPTVIPTKKEKFTPGGALSEDNTEYTWNELYTTSHGRFRKSEHSVVSTVVEVNDNRRFVDPNLIEKAKFRPIPGETKIIIFKHPSKMMVVKRSRIGIIILIVLLGGHLLGLITAFGKPSLVVSSLVFLQIGWHTLVRSWTHHWATDKRFGVWVKKPFPFKRILDDVLHKKITDLDPMDQSATGRFLDYGIILGSTAAGTNGSRWLSDGVEFVTDFRATYDLLTSEQIGK